jgi:hypothetical protein
LRRQVELFHEALPGRRCGPFFRKLQEIAKRKLSYADRDIIIKASLRLIKSKNYASKNYAKTAEKFRTQLSRENEDRKRLVETLQNICSISNELIENMYLLESDDSWFIEKDVFLFDLYRPFDAHSAIAPVEQVLSRIQRASKDAVAQCKKKGKRGPPPDTALRWFIAQLAQIFCNKVTAGHSRKEGRRASPFIDFVGTIIFALSEEAITGRNGIYTWGAIEAHVFAVCTNLKTYVELIKRAKWNPAD